MIYPRLSLKNGGGIVSEQQQAEQNPNAVHLLIGLGGTGIDCIAEIKKQVYTGIKPDDPKAEVPTYQYIQFLAVDADHHNDRLASFENSEVFDISNSNLRDEMKSSKINSRKELDWIDWDEIGAISDYDGNAGAAGSRIMGRYLMMNRADLFLARVKKMIEEGRRKAGKAYVYIHVFCGLGGGLGSGCFLDACYLIREAIIQESGYPTFLFGYFFMPDTVLAKIPESAMWVRKNAEQNGYAAMQELDYCMRIWENGGEFTQNYKGEMQIAWNRPPVDFCCLIGEAEGKTKNRQDIYWEAIGNVANYIVNYLTGNVAQYGGGLLYEFGCYWNSIRALEGNNEIGCNVAYYTISASSAKIPFREINTYLAAKTFEVFSTVKDHMPTEKEIEKLAERAKVFSVNDLLAEIEKNAGSDLAVAPDYLDWTFTRDNGDCDLVNWYTDQKAERIGIQEKNAKSMQDEKNAESLIARICEEIDVCAVDLNRGPAYAYNTMRATCKGNLQNIIDGLLDDLKTRISQLEYNVSTQIHSRKAMYEQSRNVWQADKNKIGLFGKPKRAYDRYVLDLENYVRGQIELDGMEKLKGVLETLKKQMENRETGYYQKFNRIMDNLIDTFQENLFSLNDNSKAAGFYAMPLITIDEIRPNLDAAVEEMNMPGLFKRFVQGFFYVPEMWVDENGDKISRYVKKFFVKDAFCTFSHRSVTGFLSDKYNATSETEITEHLYREYMLKLKKHSPALFPVDPSIWDITMTSETACVSVPDTAPAVIHAAEKLYKADPMFGIRQGTFKDGICVIQHWKGIPIGAYANVKRYEKNYFEEEFQKRHIYMGKGGSALFNNWNQLPPITPVSCIKGDIPREQQKLLDEAKTIYTEAKEMQLIYGDRIRQFTSDTVQKLEEMKALAANVDVGWEERTKAVSILRDVKAKLEASIKTEQLKYQDTEYSLPKGSIATEKIEETIREDYFVSSPALQTLVKRDLEKVNAVKAEIQKVEKRMELLGG